MKRKISLLIFIFFISFGFCQNILADTICKYQGQNKNGILFLEFTVDDEGDLVDDAILSGRTDSSDDTYIDKNEEQIENWDSSNLGDYTGKEDFLDDGKCPQYAIWIDTAQWFNNYKTNVSDEANLWRFEDYGNDKQGYQVMTAYDPELVNLQYTVNFHANLDGATGNMPSVTFTYGFSNVLPKNKFNFYGYIPIGWMIKNNGKWLCKTDGGTEYKENCEEKDRFIYKDNVMVDIPFDSSYPTIDLYMRWTVSSSLDPLSINQLGLGSSQCIEGGYVWNENEYGEYCNVDNLIYVSCGDARDIPSQAPKIISFMVNLLKIATPIILIIVSIISLVKSLAASKEDEIKKAQTSLIKKCIACAMAFFVISIVQFVIMKVADYTDKDGITACMSCFLNNDCNTNVYYKTMLGGQYRCTYPISNTSEDCN